MFPLSLRTALFLFLAWLPAYALEKEICQNDKDSIKCQDNEFLLIKRANFGIFPTSKCHVIPSIFSPCTQDITEKIYKSCSHFDCTIDVVDGPLFESKELDTQCNISARYSLKTSYQCIHSNLFFKLSDFSLYSDKIGGYIIPDDHFHRSEFKDYGSLLCSKYPKKVKLQTRGNFLLKIRSSYNLDFVQDACEVGDSCAHSYLSVEVTKEDSPDPVKILKICAPQMMNRNGNRFTNYDPWVDDSDEGNFLPVQLVHNVEGIEINYNFDIHSNDLQFWSKGPIMKYTMIKCPLFSSSEPLNIEYNFESPNESPVRVYGNLSCPEGRYLSPFEPVDYNTTLEDPRMNHQSTKVYCNHMIEQWTDIPESYKPKCLTRMELGKFLWDLKPTTTTAATTSTSTTSTTTTVRPERGNLTNGTSSSEDSATSGGGDNAMELTYYNKTNIGTIDGDENGAEESFFETFRKSPLLISVAVALGFIMCFIILLVCLCLFRRRIRARIQRKIALDANAGRLNQTRNFLLRSFSNSFGTYKFENGDNLMYKSDYSNNTQNYFEMDKSKLLMTPGSSTPYLMNTGTIPVRGYMNHGSESIANYMPTLGSSRMGRVTWKGSYQQVPYMHTPTISSRHNAILPSCPKGTVSMAELSRKRSQFNPYQDNTNHLYNINQLTPIPSNNFFSRMGNTHANDKFGSEGHLAMVGQQGYNDPNGSFVFNSNLQQNAKVCRLNSIRTLSSQLTEETILNYDLQQNSSELMLNDSEELPLKQSEQAKLNSNCNRISSMIRTKWANAGLNANNSTSGMVNNSESSRSSLAFTGSIKNQAFTGYLLDEDRSISEAEKIKVIESEDNKNSSETYLTPKDFNLNTLKNDGNVEDNMVYTTYVAHSSRGKNQNRPLSDAMLSNHYYLSGIQDPNCPNGERKFSYSGEEFEETKTPEPEDVYESVEDNTPINPPTHESSKRTSNTD